MIRRLLFALLLLAGCGRGQLELLGPGLGADGAVATDGPNFPGDVPAGTDAAWDAGPLAFDSSIQDGSGPRDAVVRDLGVPDSGDFGVCNRPDDCWRQNGSPPACPLSQDATWDCVAGQCQALCLCRNDCQCPFSEACLGNRCMPAGRNNLCCDNPMCQPGQGCVQQNGGISVCGGGPSDAGVPDALPRDSGQHDGGPPRPDASIMPDSGVGTPVGAACMSQSSCGPNGFCIEQQSGFPDGYCSQDCSPQGLMCPSGAVCRGFGQGQQFCLDACVTSNECRMGYGCVQLGIDPQKVCWPVNPGSTNPNGAPVGSACGIDNDCRTNLTCLDSQGWPGGYCTREYCDPQNNPCPSGSSCYTFPGSYSLCLANCPGGGTQSSCRNDYYCFGPTGQPGGCIPN